jgi:ATP-binding cassette subfamily B protein
VPPPIRRPGGSQTISLRRVVTPYVRAHRRTLALLALVSLLGGLAEAAVLVLIARIALTLSSHSSRVHINAGPIHADLTVSTLIVIAGVLAVTQLLLDVTETKLAIGVVIRVMQSTRATLVRDYLHASWALQSEERDGRLQELLTTYVGQATSAISSLSQIMVSGFSLLALLFTALAVSPLASLGVAAAATLIALLLRPIRAAVQRRSRRAAEAGLAFATALTEITATTQETRIFNVEDAIQRRVEVLNDASASAVFRTKFLSNLVPGVYETFALILILGSLAIVNQVGAVGLTALGPVVLIMVRSLTYGQATQTSIQSLHETAPYLDALTNEQERYQRAGLAEGGDQVESIGALRFDHVVFEYAPGQPVLRDISFDVPSGEIVGIVGPSGAGKSTLVQLILRLREPTSGRILADGLDIAQLSLTDWYRRVSFVPQDSRLFAGSVGANIQFFRDEVDDRAVVDAARRASLHDEILTWPLGYDTQVGERGGRLSGGQRQRICIARALAEAPDVVVFDEPTSSLDSRSESLLRHTMTSLAPRTTVFVIAHRLSTLSICDRIMVLQRGSMQGFDEPARLEANDPFYQEALRLAGMR